VSEEVSNSVTVGGIQTTIKPNGQTKQVAGLNADGYDLEIIVPATLGGPGGVAMTIVMTGDDVRREGRSRLAGLLGVLRGRRGEGLDLQ
jgi:hypothetical protein